MHFVSIFPAGDTNDNFVIHSTSGEISTSANAVLRSNGATITLVVAATDDADNVGTATANINVSKYSNHYANTTMQYTSIFHGC